MAGGDLMPRKITARVVLRLVGNTKLEPERGEVVYFLPDGKSAELITAYEPGVKGRVLGVYLSHEVRGPRYR